MKDKNEKINICQVSLARDISIVKENYFNFIKIYKNLNFFIICQNKDYDLFQNIFSFPNCEIINEDKILSLKNFKNIFLSLSKNLSYKKDFENRLSWYYQQALKISFVIDFVDRFKKKVVIWDADTIILKKIKFFNKEKSCSFGTLFEFHKPYYLTLKNILGILPPIFISSLTQFVPISVKDIKILNIKLNNFLNKNSMSTSEWISKIILRSVFDEHKIYNGSMFSEYELIGLSNIIENNNKQKAIFTLRSGLDGKLTNLQKKICILLNTYHVTYEHSHPVAQSKGMLQREQTYKVFFRIIFKDLVKFYLRIIRYNFLYYFKILKVWRGGRVV